MTKPVPFSIMTEPKTPIWRLVSPAARNPKLVTKKANPAMDVVGVAAGAAAVGGGEPSRRQPRLLVTKQVSNPSAKTLILILIVMKNSNSIPILALLQRRVASAQTVSAPTAIARNVAGRAIAIPNLKGIRVAENASRDMPIEVPVAVALAIAVPLIGVALIGWVVID